MEPLSGITMPERIFRRVDFPAPFYPMIPSVWPAPISKEMLPGATKSLWYCLLKEDLFEPVGRRVVEFELLGDPFDFYHIEKPRTG
jgi:hypothetical protein